MNVNPIAWAASTLRLFTRIDNDGVNRTVPVTEIKELPIGFPDMDIALAAKGTGATLAQVPDGTATGGDKRGIYATDWQKRRTLSTQVASGTYSFVGGGQNNIANGNYSVVCGGQDHSYGTTFNTFLGGGYDNRTTGSYAALVGGASNTASSSYSFVGGGQSNTASTSTHATVCGGNTNMASGQQSFVGGGVSCTATNSSAVAVGGNTNSATGSRSSVLGGENNTANAICSVVIGGMRGTTRSISGCIVFPAHAGAINSTTTGASQSALLVMGRQTTDATATVLTSNTSAAAATNQITLPDNSAYSFSGEVIAGVTGAGNSARWTIDGAIKRGAGVGTTAMVGTPTVTMTHFDAGAATWVVAVTADTTLGCITVTVTGAAATTIRWVCRIDTTEMTY